MTWLLLNKSALWLMEGSGYLSKRSRIGNKVDIPKDWFMFPLTPGQMVIDEDAEDPKESSKPASASVPVKPPVNPNSGAIAKYTSNKTHCTLVPIGIKDRNGFKQFLLELRNAFGKTVDSLTVISGSAIAQRRQLIHPSKDYAGSGNPIPEGIYQIGEVIKMASPEKGVGYVKIPLDIVPEFDLNNRSEFLFHDDFNRQFAVGSLGCIATYNAADMQKIVGWCLQRSRPEYLVVNYGLGVVK